jgi:glycosyltransferase involved in cell wall biosynthesis
MPAEQRTVLVTHHGAELYGADRVMLESVEAFKARGWRVVVTLPTSGPLVAELEGRGVRVDVRPTMVVRKSYLGVRGIAKLAVLAARSLLPGVRLVHHVLPDAVYVSTMTAPLWLLLARLMRVPAVCHVHEAEASASRAVRTALALPLLLARRLVFNSRFSRGVVLGVIPWIRRRCVVVYNGVPGPAEVVPARERLDGEVRLLYVGRISHRKGVIDAVEAVARLVERGVPVRLEVLGAVFPGYEPVERELRRRIAELGLEALVTSLGFDPDVWDHLARCDVLVVPSRIDEPFGNTAVEGVLAARPVVATTSGGLVEAIEDMRASISVPPGEPEAIADAVQQIVTDWPVRRADALEDAGRATARYSPAAYQRRLAGEVAALMR